MIFSYFQTDVPATAELRVLFKKKKRFQNAVKTRSETLKGLRKDLQDTKLKVTVRAAEISSMKLSKP